MIRQKSKERGASMFNSIQHFQQEGIKKIIKVFEDYQKDFSNMAEMPLYSIPYPQIKKIAALKNHIWGL